ncbi:L-azetidine-2-carboxylic acid acetyltransferase [Smittium mucronatum]|uniref:L-azetidine-2-carboxylic acid acetyltransferase n=1 Tax=Smittium mucronatum TaxID=133383 RepID=A0A1R0GPN4_9FUNG|nr:L-azetidine-2-carboxylic acid acetyltransferase [Smittium mucronatum]
MASAYGKSQSKDVLPTQELVDSLPIIGHLKSGAQYRILSMTMSTDEKLKPDAFIKLFNRPNLILHCSKMLDQVIYDGDTYPFNQQMDIPGFKDYFLSHYAFLLIKSTPSEDSFTHDGFDDYSFWSENVLGMFYIKPNFPGRCSHICNGGFIVSVPARGQGVGSAMGLAYIDLAPKCGFKASMFNLVFVNNIASVKLWQKLGFYEIGRIPKAGNLSSSSELVDAIIFYKQF